MRFIPLLLQYPLSEAEAVEARKIWSDVVSETYVATQAYSKEHDVKGKVIERLGALGIAA